MIMVLTVPIFAQTGKVNVEISGIESNKGLIQIGLYNNEQSFPIYKNVFKGIFPAANKSGVSHMFIDIPPGIYAIAVYHDENSDKKLNKNFFGMPTENYGFSLNKYSTFGPPEFDKVSFKVEEGKIISLDIVLE